MKADMLKRLVRAIADGAPDDLHRLADKIVESERELGHNKLAQQLESILNRPRLVKSGRSQSQDADRILKELPTSKRYGESLVTVVARDELEHHMVLPPETEERFARIEREFAARERLGAYGLTPRKTILLYGAPGCGKSLGAKRIAWNTGLPLIKVQFDALLSSYFGESASNLRSVFTAAKQRPCVLLLDECDFIARSRVQSKDIGEASRIVNALLLLMEEYDAPGLLVATTNIEASLDEALFRRFDDVFQVPLPGSTEIDRLLRMTLSAVQVADRFPWEKIVKTLEGASAATVVKAGQDAAKAAVLNGEKIVTFAMLTKAVNELRAGDKGAKK